MKLQTLYKRATNKKISTWSIEVVKNKYRTTSGYTDGVKTTTEWTECVGKNLGKVNETTPSDQASLQAQALWEKQVRKGYATTIADADKSTIFKPMLANKWEDRMHSIQYPIFSQPKLDGIRCIVRKDGMWTRTGKAIISAPHIYADLKPLFIDYPDLILDGELYADKYANNFNAIVSLVKKTKPTKEDLILSAAAIQYHVYDLPSHDGVFHDRMKELVRLALPDSCVIVTTDLVSGEDEVDELYESYLESGYEGQMLRVNSIYENKRSNYLLKRKSFVDEEFTILDIEEGVGNKAGMVGAFVFEIGGKVFRASPKYSHTECIEMYRNRSKLIGKTATVKYFALTPDGVPRFPTVINVDRESYE